MSHAYVRAHRGAAHRSPGGDSRGCPKQGPMANEPICTRFGRGCPPLRPLSALALTANGSPSQRIGRRPSKAAATEATRVTAALPRSECGAGLRRSRRQRGPRYAAVEDRRSVSCPQRAVPVQLLRQCVLKRSVVDAGCPHMPQMESFGRASVCCSVVGALGRACGERSLPR